MRERVKLPPMYDYFKHRAAELRAEADAVEGLVRAFEEERAWAIHSARQESDSRP